MEINTRTFYKVGVWCFLIIFLMGLLNFFIYFPITNIFSKISQVANLVFQGALVGFFRYLLKTTPKELKSEEIDELRAESKRIFR